nr:VOC family protein [bacterium]
MVTGIEHVGLCAQNTAKLRDWYIKVFRWEVVYDNRKSPATYFLLLPGGGLVEIYPAQAEGNAPDCDNFYAGWRHLALISDDVMADAERIIANGGKQVTEPKINEKGVGTFFFRDPEGNILHLIQRATPLY